MSTYFACSFIAFLWTVNGQTSDEPECKPFSEIYPTGKELCENMWDDSFTYVENNDPQAYTMWFFDNTNPNDQITTNLGKNVTNECLLSYFHRDVTAEADNYTECHPWKEAACCYQSTVKDVDTLLNSYGPEYRWDRCGELSPACERFFVQEACFYECDPNVGLWKITPNHTWKISGMPIKSDYCDAWHRACYNDLFCASDGGSYFSCAREYKALDTAFNQTVIVTEIVELEGETDKSVDVALIIIIVVIVLIVIGMFVFICYVRNREQKGNPYFAPLEQDLNSPTRDNETTGDAEMQGTR